MSTTRKSYPSDASDAEWEFLIPYLTLMREDAPQRDYSLRDVFDAVRSVVKTGCQWDFLPHDFPPWTAVYQQARRWIAAGVFEEIAHDLRMILRLVDEREAQLTATILDGRTLQSTPESGGRAGFDGAKKKKGSKIHVDVFTSASLLSVLAQYKRLRARAPVPNSRLNRWTAVGASLRSPAGRAGDPGRSIACKLSRSRVPFAPR
jgi:transposase